MSENITLEIIEKRVTFDPVVQVKTIATRDDNSKVAISHLVKKPSVRPRMGLQFVR